MNGKDKWLLPPAPNQEALEKQTTPLLERANSFVISSAEHFDASLVVVQHLDRAISTVSETFDPFCNGLHKMHRMACSLRDKFLVPLQSAKTNLLGRRMHYREEQEALRRVLDAKAALELQRQQKLELEKAAKAAAKSGDKETAEVLREQKESLPLPFISSGPAVAKQEGTYTRERYLFEIADPQQVPREYCMPDEKAIRKVVDGLGPAARIPGVRVWKETKEFSRSAL
jgi:hypothetical protein